MHLSLLHALTIRLAFAMLFGSALAHKLAHWSAFEATLSRYFEGPGRYRALRVRPIAVLIAACEAGVLVLCAWSPNGPLLAGAIGAILLAYAAAMFINLVRGNALLDCGCSWSRLRQPVSYALVARNLCLALLALALAFPACTGSLTSIEVVSVFMAALTGAVLYGAISGLLTGNEAAMRDAQ